MPAFASERPTAIDLFAGCGGLSLGLRQAGFDVRAAVELNPKRARTYRRNHLQVAVLQQDIRQVSAEALLLAAGITDGNVDLVAGCPPCQGFSRIRRRNSQAAVEDNRNDLVIEFGRVVLEMRPRAVMMENVQGLERDARFEKLIRSLRGAGFKIDWDILRLEHFGVPQRRSRLVLIGWRGGRRPNLADIHPRKPKTVRQAIGKLPKLSNEAKQLHAFRMKHGEMVMRRIRTIPKDGGSRRALPAALVLDCHLEGDTFAGGFRDVYGRIAWNDIAPTITGGCINPSKGRFLHPTKDRALSLVEAARLQTFPIWYKFEPEDGHFSIAEMIGEALPPRFARASGEYIRRSLALLRASA